MSPTPGRHWNTWDGRHPAAMVHLPTGLTVRLSAYSAKTGRYTRLPSGEVELHEHTSDGDYVRVVAHVADSAFEVELAKDADPGGFVGSVRMLAAGEWALRFWLCLEIGHVDVTHGPRPEETDPPLVRVEAAADPYTDPPVVTVRHRSTWHALVTDSRPVFSGGYADPDDLRQELEAQGYYAPHAEVAQPRWAVLRFNGQANHSFSFAVGAGNDRASALGRAAAALVDVSSTVAAGRSRAREGSEAFRAVRDVVAWNTVWDSENGRPMTVLTRNWLSGKFGGWGVWLDDVLFHALLAAYAGDWETAYANLDASLTTLAADGNLPCLRTAYEEWVDRSQPPVAGYVLWRIFLLSGDRALLDRHLPTVLRAHDWWFATRDGNGDGLLEFGSTPTGSGAFVHSKQAALDEAAMDNLPAFDEAEFDPAAHTLDLAEPALNSLLALDAEALAAMLEVTGEPDEAHRVRSRGEQLAGLIHDELWDDERGAFAGRRWDGTFARSLAPTSFYPWLCGAADEEQTRRMVDLLLDEDKFWGRRVLPASTYDDPATADQVYWRGRIWPPLLFWTWEGLRRADRRDLADAVAGRAWEMFLDGWRDRRCFENFHHSDPALDASPDSDPFYGWGALLPLMALMSTAEHSPWDGRVFTATHGPAELREPGARWVARPEAGGVRITRNDTPVVSVRGASRVAVDEHAGWMRVRLLDAATGPSVTLLGVTEADVVAARSAGKPVDGRATGEGWVIELPGGGTELQVWLTGERGVTC